MIKPAAQDSDKSIVQVLTLQAKSKLDDYRLNLGDLRGFVVIFTFQNGPHPVNEGRNSYPYQPVRKLIHNPTRSGPSFREPATPDLASAKLLDSVTVGMSNLDRVR